MRFELWTVGMEDCTGAEKSPSLVQDVVIEDNLVKPVDLRAEVGIDELFQERKRQRKVRMWVL
jgi:hypothetical protein